MTLKSPKVSVCMPVYNGERYIAESIESVLSQTYGDFYLNIFDNLSNDHTVEIIQGFKDPRIRYFRNGANLGLVGNHRRCVEGCETPYLCIFHDDDVMLPTNLEKKVRILDTHDQVGLVFSNLELIDEHGRVLDMRWNEECRRDYVSGGAELFVRYLKRMPIGALFFIGSVMSRSSCLRQAGGFRSDYSSLTCDSELWLRMLLRGDAACLGEPLIRYRNYLGMATTRFRGVEFLDEHLKVVERIFEEERERIAVWQRLRREVVDGFGAEALRRGLAACGRDDFAAAELYLRWARERSPAIGRTKDYRRLWLRLKLGPRAVQMMRPLKRKVQTLIGHS